MGIVLTQVQYHNAYNKALTSGIGFIVLTSLYYLGFNNIGTSVVGSGTFKLFCVFCALIGLFRVLLGLVRNKLSKKIFLQSYFILLSLGSFVWGVSGVLLFFYFRAHNAEHSPLFDELVKAHFFMIFGVLHSIPQFLRHTKYVFVLNLILLYVGILSLIPVYFQNTNEALYTSLILILFGVVVTPQYLKNWRTEKELVSKEQELQAIIDGFPGAVSEIENGKYKRINRFFKEKIATSIQIDHEWINQPISKVNKDKNWIDIIESFNQDDKTQLTIEHKFTEDFGGKTYLTAFSKIKPNTVLVASLDIQNLVELRAEAESQKLLAQEKARLASLGLMAGGIAHEINNPLSVIQSRADMAIRALQKSEVPDTQRALDSLIKISPMVLRISKIIQSMRNLTRVTDESNREVFKIGSILEEVLILIEEKLKYSKIDFRFEGEGLSTEIYANKNEISQVFINAINNSVQAVQNLENKWIRIYVGKLDEKQIKISIQDSGAGIPLEFRDKIMTPLFTTKGPREGTGLGLALSRKIIELHGGKFFFDHQQSHTTLVIELPLNK